MIKQALRADQTPILDVKGLRTVFGIGEGAITAVDDVTFSVFAGETFGIVGESGSGKSVTAYSILGLVERPGEVVAGEIRFRGRDLRDAPQNELRKVRGSKIAMIFQDPMTSLHPLLRIERQMVDAIFAHRHVSRAQARAEAIEALHKVSVAAPEERLRAYPHQLSGGMRQRVAIAIAMINKPDLIIADEPTTALDVTTQAQIMSEMKELCAATGTALVWITHDLAVISEIADRVAVMYAGNVVEIGGVDDILSAPAHPYTAGLLESVPSRNVGSRRLPQIPGSVQSAYSAPGCRFAPRCSRREPACDEFPQPTSFVNGRSFRCFYPLLGSQLAEVAR
jgi:peptide/nickel transport system ATP-binding protein